MSDDPAPERKTLNLRLDRAIILRLKMAALARDMTVSDLVARLLADHADGSTEARLRDDLKRRTEERDTVLANLEQAEATIADLREGLAKGA